MLNHKLMTQGTPHATELIKVLQNRRHLDWVWKALFLTLLEKLVERKHQEPLARLFANAALKITDNAIMSENAELEMERWESVLDQLKNLKVGRGHLNKLTQTMNHWDFFSLYQITRDRLGKAKTKKEIKEAIRRPWKIMRGSSAVSDTLIGIAETNDAQQSALEIVAKAYAMKAESLVVIFRNHKWALDMPYGDIPGSRI